MLARLENEFTSYVQLAVIYLPQLTMQACVKAEFVVVGLKAACTHLRSSLFFLSDDETEDLKGNFHSRFYFFIFALQNPSAVDGEGAEGRAVRLGFSHARGVWLCLSPRHYIQCLIP